MILSSVVKSLKTIGENKVADILESRTEKDWKECENPFYNRNLADEAFIYNKSKSIEESIYLWLSKSFVWNRTEEGAAFWSEVCSRIIDEPHP